MSGIYQIINLDNGRRYIGSAVNLLDRETQHWRELRGYRHHNSHLQHAFDLYGEHRFIFNVIEPCDADCLIEREQFHIDVYKSRLDGLYNICPTAGSRLGAKCSDETKRKISEVQKGKVIPFEVREKLSKSHMGLNTWMKGRHLSDEARAKMSKTKKGKKFSEEHRRNIAKTKMGNFWNVGRHHTEDAKKKMSEKAIGHRPWLTGRIRSEETRKNLSESGRRGWIKRKQSTAALEKK